MNDHQKTKSKFDSIVQSFVGDPSASHEENERAREAPAQKVNSASVLVWTQDGKVLLGTDATGSIIDFGGKVGKHDEPSSVARKELMHATGLYTG